jgi:hypothetical protein
MEDKDKDFCQYWQDKRENKWAYILKTGVFLWGIPGALITYWWIVDFQFSAMEWHQLLSRLLISSLVGGMIAYFQYHAQENRYQLLRRKEEKDNTNY